MSKRPNWHQYFIGLAQHASTRSADPRTRVGCVAIDGDKHVVTTGYNGLPYGTADSPAHWEDKDALVVHAEENMVTHAARASGGLKGTTVYSTHIPCLRCTRLLIQCGVTAVYYEHDNTTGYDGKWVPAQWGHIVQLFGRAGVELRRVTPNGVLVESACSFPGDV